MKRALAVCVCLLLSGVARAAETSLDAPVVPRAVRHADGSVTFNAPAYTLLNNDMIRLQSMEVQHKGENWGPVVLVSTAVGVIVGIIAAILVQSAVVALSK